jgi:hypothetical protein
MAAVVASAWRRRGHGPGVRRARSSVARNPQPLRARLIRRRTSPHRRRAFGRGRRRGVSLVGASFDKADVTPAFSSSGRARMRTSHTGQRNGASGDNLLAPSSLTRDLNFQMRSPLAPAGRRSTDTGLRTTARLARGGRSTIAATHIATTLPDGRVSCATYAVASSPAGAETIYPSASEFVAACGTSRHGRSGDVTVILDRTEVTAGVAARLLPTSRP